MELKLKIVGGKHHDRIIAVRTANFLIGRDEGCSLRPTSNVVGRRHCQLLVEADRVRLQDLKSSNGTFVNGVRIEGEQTLAPGDHVKVGPLEFQVLFAAAKFPLTADVPESRATTETARGQPSESDIMRWLTDVPSSKDPATGPLADTAVDGISPTVDTGEIKIDATQADFWPVVADSADSMPRLSQDKLPKHDSKESKQPDPNHMTNSRDAASAAIDMFRNRKKDK